MSQSHPGAATVAVTLKNQPQSSGSVRTVAVVGPPNSGKSTLFNRLTGLRQKVANYPGVTVEKRVGQARLSGSLEVELVDLPGIYSLVPMSEDEQVAYDVLTGRMTGISPPDAIVLILDSTNLGRHLSFAAPILSLGVPTLVVLNLADDLRRRGGKIDLDKLAGRLGTPVVLISSARTGEGFRPSRSFWREPWASQVRRSSPSFRMFPSVANGQPGWELQRTTRRLLHPFGLAAWTPSSFIQ